MRRESFTLTTTQFAALEKLAVSTNSLTTKGPSYAIGRPSWRAFLRRIAQGELRVVRRGHKTVNQKADSPFLKRRSGYGYGL
jgi:hypothetical protein